MRLTVTMLLSGKTAVRKGAGWDEISLVFLVVSSVDPCLLCRRADDRATALVEKSHFSTGMQYCGWRHIDRKVLGWFVFFPFCFRAFFG